MSETSTEARIEYDLSNKIIIENTQGNALVCTLLIFTVEKVTRGTKT